jgi:hypothetical protein
VAVPSGRQVEVIAMGASEGMKRFRERIG